MNDSSMFNRCRGEIEYKINLMNFPVLSIWKPGDLIDR